MRFVDTNVLPYAVSTDPREASKATVALQLLEARDLALSVQVLQEFYVQATRPTKPDKITHDQAAALAESWLRFPIQEVTVEVLRAAVSSAQRYQLSYWDAAIIESARLLGCREVLSEDLNAGQDYGGVRVLNPFASVPRKSRRKH